MVRSRGIAAAMAAAAALGVAACGGAKQHASDGGGGGSRPGSATLGTTTAAKRAPTLAAAQGATGTVTLCTSADSAPADRAAARSFNDRNSARGLRLVVRTLPGPPDRGLDEFAADRHRCDVYAADVTQTAALAARLWLLDMSDYLNQRRPAFIQSTVSTVRYDGKYWGVPQSAYAALLYYRSDRVMAAPDTWQQLYEEAEPIGGIVFPGAASEDLTAAYLEVAFAAGGTVLSADGTHSEIDSSENIEALQLMVSGLRDGAVTPAVPRLTDSGVRQSFAAGGPAFARAWPSAYGLDAPAPAVGGRVAVAPLPAFEAGGRSGVLGGRNLVISSATRDPRAAVVAVDFLTSPEVVTANAVQYRIGPALNAVYDDPAVRRALPHARVLKRAIGNAGPRPISPVYPQISRAIAQNVHAALAGQVLPSRALQLADQQIRQALRAAARG